MKILYYDRGMGKTREIIERAAEKQLYIVCSTEKQCEMIFRQATNMQKCGFIHRLPPRPVTFEEVKNIPNDRGVCIDELEITLRSLLGNREIDTISISREETNLEIISNDTYFSYKGNTYDSLEELSREMETNSTNKNKGVQT